MPLFREQMRMLCFGHVQRLHYEDRDEPGDAKVKADSTLKVFHTANGRPVLEGRGVFPDVEIEKTYISYVLSGLMDNDLLFDFALSREFTIEDPRTYTLSEEDWEAFIVFVEAEFSNGNRETPYQAESETLLGLLEEVMDDDGILASNEEALNALQLSVSPNIRKDITRFKDQIKKSLEEEIVFQKTNANGLFEYQLPRDPNAIKAVELLESGEYKNILVGPAK